MGQRLWGAGGSGEVQVHKREGTSQVGGGLERPEAGGEWGSQKEGGEMGMRCGRLRRGGKATGLGLGGVGRRQAEFTHPCQSIY